MNGFLQLREFCAGLGCICLENEPMSLHTSFKIGGAADLFVRPEDEKTAALVLEKARELRLPLTVVGKGSDLLISDAGLRGVVLSMDEAAARPTLSGETALRCPAGASLTALCVFAQKQGLAGLEFAYGIPGSVGGAVYMNAGAYGGEIGNCLASADFYDPDGTRRTLPTDALNLSYRHSYFTDHDGCLIVSALFALTKDDPAAIRARMEEHMDSRKCKQPLEYPSAGSTFKRPTGAFASALIDRCGLKGARVGGAMVSEKHAGFVINYDSATCADVRALIAKVQRTVHAQTGFTLECEIKLLGEDAGDAIDAIEAG